MTSHWIHITCLVVFVCLVLPVSSNIGFPGGTGLFPGNSFQFPPPGPFPPGGNEPQRLIIFDNEPDDQGGSGGFEMLIPLLLLPRKFFYKPTMRQIILIIMWITSFF